LAKGLDLSLKHVERAGTNPKARAATATDKEILGKEAEIVGGIVGERVVGRDRVRPARAIEGDDVLPLPQTGRTED
jgi:hypothetical protein